MGISQSLALFSPAFQSEQPPTSNSFSGPVVLAELGPRGPRSCSRGGPCGRALLAVSSSRARSLRRAAPSRLLSRVGPSSYAHTVLQRTIREPPWCHTTKKDRPRRPSTLGQEGVSSMGELHRREKAVPLQGHATRLNIGSARHHHPLPPRACLCPSGIH